MRDSQCFAPDGQPIGYREWQELYLKRRKDTAPESWWRKYTVVDDAVSLSTVWEGINRGRSDGPPMIWITMVVGGQYNEFEWLYASRQDAFDDHERLVAALRAGENPEDVAAGDSS
jgi:hypothetical protein